jgi:hypothetical protein
LQSKAATEESLKLQLDSGLNAQSRRDDFDNPMPSELRAKVASAANAVAAVYPG